ncbi:unnamed protein product [Schistosoma curassoni]|uniref:EF-hand domain-containing protein n=1 Tax=Schistosoma curassoni TaxID=6186 RepID=A0A183KDR5_9TREM|nr:unnamed protein product [Schistosoma curassoni]
MFISDVSEPYETLRKAILRRGDPTGRQELDQLFNNADLQRDSATDMLLRMRKVIGQGIFDEGLFKRFFMSVSPASAGSACLIPERHCEQTGCIC